MLGTFIFVVCCFFVGLVAFFYFQGKKHKNNPPSRTVYAAHTQRRVLPPTNHMTGEAYGKLLRAAQGDRQQVELWIVEAQCNLTGRTRSEIIELLAKER
ncbi:hypothetical protein [Vogesella sp. XCS3]|uniref:hypothetical protein n=1 Tax=Vogesella sp. XCS3 TaxID=2877939 RepID=UPI001B653EB3|nr:hypothetical protein [Vogesella sp. XCS3]MBP7581876.1 hypothetical protein [Vogesella sp.]UDM15852.1 hypothetical protein LCH97_11090 [Vogesella sp. XCS3]